MIVLTLNARDPVSFPISVAGGDFTLLGTEPSFEERMMDDGLGFAMHSVRSLSNGDSAQLFRERFSRRVNCITGWKGVVDPKGDPIEFSQVKLRVLMARFPNAITQLSPYLTKLFSEADCVGESSASPSDSQPADGSTTRPEPSANTPTA